MMLQRAMLGGLLALLTTVGCRAGQPEVIPTPASKPLLSEITIDSSYDFSAPMRFTHKVIGHSETLRNKVEFIHRVPVSGPWHFQFGAVYDRFDFGGSATGLLPTTLQAAAIPVGLAYMVDGHVGFQAEFRPGFYFGQEITSGAFDAPFYLGGGIPLIKDKLYGVWGVGTSFLRRYPVVPVGGIIWLINDRTRLLGYLPEPRLVYDLSDEWQVWIGGELVAGSFKNGRSTDPRLNGTTVDYEDYRAGVGAIWSPAKHWKLVAAAGYSIQRNLTFHRANQGYSSDPVPYVKLQLSGAF